jgi:hypothetical protein
MGRIHQKENIQIELQLGGALILHPDIDGHILIELLKEEIPLPLIKSLSKPDSYIKEFVLEVLLLRRPTVIVLGLEYVQGLHVVVLYQVLVDEIVKGLFRMRLLAGVRLRAAVRGLGD